MRIPCPHGGVNVVRDGLVHRFLHWDGTPCPVLSSFQKGVLDYPPAGREERVARSVARNRRIRSYLLYIGGAMRKGG